MFNLPYSGNTDINVIANVPTHVIKDHFNTLLRVGEEIQQTGVEGTKELFEERNSAIMDDWKKVQKRRDKGKINKKEYDAQAKLTSKRQVQMLQDLKEFVEARNIIADCISFAVSREGNDARRDQLTELLTAAGAARALDKDKSRELMATAVFGAQTGKEMNDAAKIAGRLLKGLAESMGDDEAMAISIYMEETDEDGNVIKSELVGKTDNFDKVQAEADANPDAFASSTKTYARAMQEGLVPDDCPCPGCVQRREKYGEGPYDNLPSDVEPSDMTVKAAEGAKRLLQAIVDSAKKDKK